MIQFNIVTDTQFATRNHRTWSIYRLVYTRTSCTYVCCSLLYVLYAYMTSFSWCELFFTSNTPTGMLKFDSKAYTYLMRCIFFPLRSRIRMARSLVDIREIRFITVCIRLLIHQRDRWFALPLAPRHCCFRRRFVCKNFPNNHRRIRGEGGRNCFRLPSVHWVYGSCQMQEFSRSTWHRTFRASYHQNPQPWTLSQQHHSLNVSQPWMKSSQRKYETRVGRKFRSGKGTYCK